MCPIRLRGARRHGVRLVGATLMLAVALVGMGAGPVAAADAEQVVIAQPSDELSWRFDPTTVRVGVGSTVTWVNQGSVPMTVTSSDGLFDSDLIAPGGSFTATFDTPGTFRYFCVPYPHMKGMVVVTRGDDGGERGRR